MLRKDEFESVGSGEEAVGDGDSEMEGSADLRSWILNSLASLGPCCMS